MGFFHDSSVGKESACNAGDTSLIPGSGRSTGKGIGYPLQSILGGNESKEQCCKEQYCIGTWNARSMNQGKLEVVKQEMARVNVKILGISKLKWTGMVNLTQMTIVSTTAGRNPSEEME